MPATLIITLAANVEQKNLLTPTLAGQPAVGICAAGTPSIFGANHPGRNSSKYINFRGDGARTSWSAAQVSGLANLHEDAGSLTTATRLRVIVLVNGMPLTRQNSTTALAAGQFRVTGTGAATTLEFQAAPAAGAVIEVLKLDSADVAAIHSGTLVVGVDTPLTMRQFIVASAACQIRKIKD